jgi:3-methyladenine DNA glycosylase/8-oxoguanine DNA glycosylase
MKQVNGTSEVLGKVREALKVTGETDVVQVATEAAKERETLAKVRQMLGATGEMDVVKVAEEAAQAVKEAKKTAFEAMVNEVVSQKVTGEMAQALVKRMLNLPETATKEQVAGEIDKILADPTVKEAIGRFYLDKPPVVGNTNQQQPTGLRVKRQAI